MFIVSDAKTCKWPVKVETAADNGKTVTQTLTAIFRRIDSEELEIIQKANPVDPDASVPVQQRAVANQFIELLDGWEGVADKQRQPIEYSPELLRALCTGPDGMAFCHALQRALVEMRTGIKAKN